MTQGTSVLQKRDLIESDQNWLNQHWNIVLMSRKTQSLKKDRNKLLHLSRSSAVRDRAQGMYQGIWLRMGTKRIENPNW